MGKRKFITVARAADILYWTCPGKGCYQYYDMVVTGRTLPRTIHCQCGSVYIVEQITQLGTHSARVLIEVKV